MTRYDFSEVRGQAEAIAAVEVAAVKHLQGERGALLLVGPPGVGKTMIARRVATVLPAMTDAQVRWVAAEYAPHLYRYAPELERPFRAPHHTISAAALTGPGNSLSRAADAPCRCGQAVNDTCLFHTLPRGSVGPAGELQLARHGVLFLDELTEFTSAAIQALGNALRRCSPASRPMLVLAANKCPCGFAGLENATPTRSCMCGALAIERHHARLQGLLGLLGVAEAVTIAKIDYVPLADLRGLPEGESSAAIGARVAATLRGDRS